MVITNPAERLFAKQSTVQRMRIKQYLLAEGRPSVSEARGARAQTDVRVRRHDGKPGLRFLNVTFHSSVALPGATPYVANESQLDELCLRLEGILEYILTQHRATALALSDVPAFLGDSVLTS